MAPDVSAALTFATVRCRLRRRPCRRSPDAPTREAPLVPCRCSWLNTLSGRAATDYVTQHLDVVRDEGHGRRVVSCPEGNATFLIEPDDGVYGGDEQVRLRRVDR